MQHITMIKSWLLEYLAIDQQNAWLLAVFVIVFITLLTAFFAKAFFNKLAIHFNRTKNHWDDILLQALRRPAIVMIWLLGGSLALQAANFMMSDANLLSNNALHTLVNPVRRVGVVVLIAWFVIRFIRLAEVKLVDPDGISTTLDHTTINAFGKLLRLSIIITVTLVILQTLGYSISGVLAFGGIGGIAVGFAAKDLLANFFGGLMIYMDRPFKVGDWIRSPDKEIEGVVEDIGWRLTRIRTFDKRPLYVPNATFTSISVENPSRMTNRRIHETICVRYCDIQTLSQIIDDVSNMLKQHEDIDVSQTLMVNFNKMADSSLEFFVYTFTKTTNWERFHRIKQDVLFRIAAIIERHEAQIAYPTSTVKLDINKQTDELKSALLDAQSNSQ